eukprot:2855906-Amphidinium_carterae.1
MVVDVCPNGFLCSAHVPLSDSLCDLSVQVLDHLDHKLLLFPLCQQWTLRNVCRFCFSEDANPSKAKGNKKDAGEENRVA